MELDLDPLGIDHNIIETVEVDSHQTVNPLFLSFDGIDDRHRSLSLGSTILPHRTQDEAHGMGNGILVNQYKQTFSARHVSSSPPTFVPRSAVLHPQVFSGVAIPPPRYRPLPYSTSRTGLAFDQRMVTHEHVLHPHPENPRRIIAIWEELKAGGLEPKDDEEVNEYHLVRIFVRPASEAQIGLVHDAEYIGFVRNLQTLTMSEAGILTLEKEEDDSIYFHPESWSCASLAAGAAIEATKAVVEGKVKNAIAVIRPPGHHAEHDKACGFCFFNNVCVAAKVVQKDFPDLCRKVLILDWDVHHGNGVQQAFEDDPNVLYISLHVHMEGKYYPQGDYGDHLHCGTGNGVGKNINIPWSTKGMGDAEYIYAFQQVVMPVAVEFDPDLVIISAGFDAADGDHLGGCFVSPAGYSHMTHMLMQLAKGKVVACLEGGYGFATKEVIETEFTYDPRPIARSALAVTRTLMGEPPERLGEMSLQQTAIDVVRKVIRTQSKFWKCLYPKDLDIRRKIELGSERLHDIIREWQSKIFWEQYRMAPLVVLRERLSKSFENQVLATTNYTELRPLLVIFHDPPEALGFTNTKTNELDLHNTWLTDVSKTYVDWAVKNNFAVVDVNIPKHITDLEDQKGFQEAETLARRAAVTRDVAEYLWRNYIEPNDSSHIFLLGVGDAYTGIVKLLNENGTAADRVDHTFAFIAQNSLLRVERPGDDGQFLSNHFFKHSTIFVDREHPAFDPARKRLSKKYGHVLPSPVANLQDMLLQHRDQVTAKLLELTAEWRNAEAEDELVQSGMNGVTNGNTGIHAPRIETNGVPSDSMDGLEYGGTMDGGLPLEGFPGP